MNEHVKRHAPTAAIATAAVVAMRLMMPSVPSAPAPAPALPDPAQPAGHPSSLGSGQLAHNGQETRLVSCGDSRKARVIGGDTSGEVVTGGSDRCTVVFAAPWTSAPQCEVTGGHVESALPTEIVVRDFSLTFTYDCEAPK